MKKDLKYFMKPREEKTVKVLGPEPFVDEKGERLVFEVKVLKKEIITEIDENYTEKKIATDPSGSPYIANREIVWQVERDVPRANRHVIAEALVYPDLKDAELMKFYNCQDVSDMPLHVFPDSDDFNYVFRVVMAVNKVGAYALDEKELVEEAKN